MSIVQSFREERRMLNRNHLAPFTCVYMRVVLLSILTGVHLCCFAQHDSITFIEPIEVVAPKSLENTLLSHELLISADPNRSVADQLQLQTGVYVRSQGPGALQTISYKGMGAMHINVDLNGLSLQSSMNGIMDLSLLNSYHFGAVHFGEQQKRGAGRQNLGASIQLRPTAFEQRAFFVSLASNSNKSLGFKWGAKQIQASVLSTWGPNHVNLESYGGNGRLTNTAFNAHSAVIQAYDSLGRWLWKPLLRLQYSDREIPSGLNSVEDGVQEDINIMLSNSFLSEVGANWNFSFTSGLWREQINYSSEKRNQSFTSISYNFNHQFNAIRQIGKRWRFWIGIGQDGTQYSSEALLETVFWNRFKSNIALEKKKGAGVFSLNAQVQEYNRRLVNGFDLRYKYTLQNHRWVIRMAKVNRLPTLNELYWYEPGFAMGNQDLEAEMGYRLDLFYQFDYKSFSININPFIGMYERMIQWIGFPVIEATNQREILARGAIVKLSQKISLGNENLLIESNHQFQKSQINDPKHDHYQKQLIFTPEYSGNLRIHWYRDVLNLYVNGLYISKNYITGGNEQFIDPYFLLEAGGSVSIWNLRLGLRLENVLNQAYFSFPQRPNLPRTIHLNLTYKINNNDKSIP